MIKQQKALQPAELNHTTVSLDLAQRLDPPRLLALSLPEVSQ